MEKIKKNGREERKNAKVIKIILLALVLGLSGTAVADSVNLDLFSLGCPTGLDFNSPYWQTSFDLGVTFTEISNVYIDWSGGITAGLVQQFDPQTLEPIGDPFPFDVGVRAGLGFNPYLRSTDVWGGGATYPDPEPFDYLSEFELLGKTTWSDLLDGTGTINLGYDEAISPYGIYVEHGSIVLSDATLVVEGAIVPEPASILLLAVGVLGLRAKLSCRSK